MSAHRIGDVLVFIPIYGEYDYVQSGFSKVMYYFLISIEFVFLMYNLTLSCLGIGIIRKSSIFHRNMLNLGLILLVNSYLHILARSILLFVQLKLFLPDEKVFATWPNAVIIFASVLRCYQALITVVLFGSIVIERLFATIFLYDYENNKRSWISYALVFWTIFLALSLGLSRTFNAENLTNKVAQTLVQANTLIPGTIAVVLVVFNHYRVKRILLSDRYSLAAKFQLKENLKAFKFLLLILVWCLCGFGVAGLVFVYRDQHCDDLKIVTLCGAAYETVTTIAFACGVSTCFITQPEWRRAMRGKIVRIVSIFRHKSPDDDTPVQPPQRPSSNRRSRSNRIDDESAVYFNNLFNEWDKVYLAKQSKKR